MSFRVNVKVPKRLEENVRKRLEDAANNKELVYEVGEITRKNLIVSVLQAKNPASGKPFTSRNITDEWRDRKKALSKVNSAFDSKSGGGSKLARLMFTGQWINSIKTSIERIKGKRVAKISPTGMHDPYKNLDGTTSGNKISNEKLGEYFIDQGRDWRGASIKTRRALVSFVKRFLREKLNI
jgi:hypothetical protein